MDVCLLYMPFGPIETPPLGMALLAAEAKEAGLSARAVYPAFRFAERIGYFRYKALSMAMGGFHICEWTFARAAFANECPADDDFLREVIEWERRNDPEKHHLIFNNEASFQKSCREVRDAAEAFVEEQAARILELRPTIVGCSSSYYQNCASLAVLRVLKRLNPEIITLMGGTNCESSMGMALGQMAPWVDFVVSGEGDELFGPFCRKLLEEGPVLTEDEIPLGVLTRRGESEEPLSLRAEPPVAVVGNLDDLPNPDFDDYLHDREKFAYKSALPPLNLSVETSRGCWWGQRGQCSFCGGNGKRIAFRAKTPARFLRELNELHSRYGVHELVVTDNILDMSYFKTVLPELASARPPRYSFFVSTKSNLGEEHCRRMADAGIARFQPGIESLHDELLRILNKGNRAIDHVALLKFAHENGIKANWNILTDIPGERQEWYAQMASWLPLIAHLQPPHKVMSIHFDRFSPYHRNPDRFGLRLAPSRWYSFIYPLSPEQMEAFAARFEIRHENATEPSDREIEGKEMLKGALARWKACHQCSPTHPTPPALTVREEGSCSVIQDTRPCALSEQHILRGVHDQVHRACRSPLSAEGVLEAVRSAKTGEDSGQEITGTEAIREALAFLQQQKLLLRLGSLFLALALKEPLRPFAYPPDPGTLGFQAILKARGLSYWDALERLDKTRAGG